MVEQLITEWTVLQCPINKTASRDRRRDLDGVAESVGPLARLDTLFHGISLEPCSGKPPVSPGYLCQGAFLGSHRPSYFLFRSYVVDWRTMRHHSVPKSQHVSRSTDSRQTSTTVWTVKHPIIDG